MGGEGSNVESALSKMELISPRIMKTTFAGDPGTTIIEAYSPTNVPTSEVETESFYQDLRKAIDSTPQQNFLAILGDKCKLKKMSIQPFRRK